MLCSDNPDLQNEKSEALLLFIHLFFGFVLGSFLIFLTCSSSLCCKLKETQFAIPLPYFLLPLHD